MMNIRLRFFTLLSFVFIMAISSASAGNTVKETSSYYAYIQEVHHGNVIWHKDSSNPHDLGVMYRAVIFLQEPYYGVFVETLRISDEGEAEVVHTQQVDMDMPRKLKFLGWLSPNTFKIVIENNMYDITVLNDGKTIDKNKISKSH